MADAEVVYEVRADYSNIEDDLDNANSAAEKKTREGSSKLASVAGTTAKAIGASMLAAGTAAVGIGVAAVNSAVSMDQAMNGFIASTGKGTEEAERYQGVLEKIYANNYGEDFQDIADAMGNVSKQLGDMDDGELQAVTESAFALRDTFEYDIAESTRAAKTLMDNFGTSGEDAMSLIAAGAQNGLDYSGELMDSINEYSVQFSKIGMDADDMFKIFQKGADSGAFNLDKIGDAVKEMSVRVIDGSDTTSEGFALIGLNASEMAEKFAAGGDSAKEAFQQTIEAMAGMEDPLKQNLAGTDIFGTMWEDLGPDVVTQLADITDGAYDTADAMDGIKEVKYDDIGSMFDGLKRSVEMLILPLGSMLVPVLSDMIENLLPIIQEELPPIIELISRVIQQMLPLISQILPVLAGLFSSIFEQMMPLIEQALPVFIGLFQKFIPIVTEVIKQIMPSLLGLVGELFPAFMQLMDALMPLVEQALPSIIELFQGLIPPIMEIIQQVMPPLLEVIEALIPVCMQLIDSLMPILELFIELLNPILDLISEAILPLIESLMPLVTVIIAILKPALEVLLSVFTAIFDGIVDHVSMKIQIFTDILNNIVGFVKNVFTGNWKGVWENIKNIFLDIVTGIGNAFKSPFNFIIDCINGFINGVNKIEIPDWVPIVGGEGFHIPNIPRLRIGMDYVPSDDFPAYLHKGEAVLTAQENAIYQSIGGYEGLMQALSQPTGSGDTYINLQSTGESLEIDYDRLGVTTARAIANSNIAFKLDRREVARLVEEVRRN